MNAEAEVVGIFVLLNFSIFPGSPDMTSLMTLADVLAVAEHRNHFDAKALEEIHNFANNAPMWSKRNGGIGELVKVTSQSH